MTMGQSIMEIIAIIEKHLPAIAGKKQKKPNKKPNKRLMQRLKKEGLDLEELLLDCVQQKVESINLDEEKQLNRLIELIFECGIDPDIRRGTPLSIAAGAGSANCIEFLEAHGADLNQYKHLVFTNAALSARRSLMYEYLSARGFELSAEEQRKIITMVSFKGNRDALKFLHEKYPGVLKLNLIKIMDTMMHACRIMPQQVLDPNINEYLCELVGLDYADFKLVELDLTCDL